MDLVTDFHDKVMASADILSATGTAIMSFEEVMCQLPKQVDNFVYISI